MAEQVVIDDPNFTVATKGNISFLLSGRHGYANTSGSKPWQLAVYLDGVLVNATGGAGAYTDTPNMQAVAIGVPPGTHHIQATWYGHSSMTFTGAVLIVQEAYK